jgi:hypothetical protein
VDEVNKKIKSLKTQFRREHQNKIARERSGAGVTSLEKEWFGYNSLSFLIENNVSVGSRSSIEVSVYSLQ